MFKRCPRCARRYDAAPADAPYTCADCGVLLEIRFTPTGPGWGGGRLWDPNDVYGEARWREDRQRAGM